MSSFNASIRRRRKTFLCLAVFAMNLLFSHNTLSGGLYLTQIATPGSVGTAGVGNVVNNMGPDSAFTNPAGMTGIQADSMMAGIQVAVPVVEFDSSVATAGGKDGGNAGEVAPIPGTYLVKVLSDDWRLGFSISGTLGGGVDYGKDFVGRYQATKSELAGVGISPSLAYRVNDKLSIGGGVTFIYSKLDMDIALNQPGNLADGEVSMEELDDWGVQGFLGLTYQITDRAMLGIVYRSESETDMRGDLKFKNLLGGAPPGNALSSSLDSAKISWDYPQMVSIGLKYKLTEQLSIMADVDWEDWSEFSDNYVSIGGGTVNTNIDRNFDDTWHGGVALQYKFDDSHLFLAGISYDSSAVEDKYRTADLPLDEQLKVSVGFGRRGQGNLDYSLALSYIYLGEGKIDQTVQGERFKGEFENNFIFFPSATINYRF